ncbi:hypothetical protein BGX29_006123 [Mortierella sp. GBA35]|nr:hypothetical protein BGX29_006123 [Mortierella sp. GBA35]
MSLQVNFTTYGRELKAAYEDILRPADPQGGNNWALFGYDKGSNDLKVLSQGSGGLEELEEEFLDGKIQYAFVRVVDKYSQLKKFVLIGWCGDGVPESKKGLFNSHLADVSQFLKGYHLQINARNEADVTPAQIMKRLDEGSGSKYSIHKENYEAERIRPLQSAYKKTEIPDIAALQRNPTKPEPAPKFNVSTKPVGYSSSASSAGTPSKLEDRVWPPPSSTASSNVSPPTSASTPEQSWKSSMGGASSYTSSTPSTFNKVAPPASLSSYGGGAPEPVVNKAHQIRLEREAREKEERERIKREIEASEARQRQSASSGGAGAGGFTSTAQRLAEERKLQAQKEAEREKEQQQASSRGLGFSSDSPSGLSQSPNRIREERLAREKEERERAQAEDSARSAREAFKAREESSLRAQTDAREDELRKQKEQEQRRQREAREADDRHAQEQANLQRQQQEEEEEAAARQRHQQEEEEEEERRLQQQQRQRQKDEDEAKQHRQREQKEAEERQRRKAEEDAERENQRRLAEEEEESERKLQEEVSAAAAQSVALGADALLASTEHPELNVSGSVSAIVLYSYEKAEENEMSLIEGEIIRNVTELDVGWWSGESEDGTRSGLFPANYVEVIEHAHDQDQHQDQHHDVHDDHHHAAAAGHDYHHGLDTEHDAYAAQQDHGHHDTGVAAAGGEKKQSAVALYDYQAGEPNELSFNEGEAITEIDFVTEDWWSGKSEAGATGLFPANYVELIQ